MPTLHDFQAVSIDGQPADFASQRGKVLLVVNTASKCGFTPQFEGLEALHAAYQPKGLVVLGFPSGDFGGQELDSAKDIADFCFNTYGVKFPMFAKSSVKGRDANPLYQALAKASGDTPQWNFHKFLIDRKGRVAGSFGSMVGPDSSRLKGAIDKALAAG